MKACTLQINFWKWNCWKHIRGIMHVFLQIITCIHTEIQHSSSFRDKSLNMGKKETRDLRKCSAPDGNWVHIYMLGAASKYWNITRNPLEFPSQYFHSYIYTCFTSILTNNGVYTWWEQHKKTEISQVINPSEVPQPSSLLFLYLSEFLMAVINSKFFPLLLLFLETPVR